MIVQDVRHEASRTTPMTRLELAMGLLDVFFLKKLSTTQMDDVRPNASR